MKSSPFLNFGVEIPKSPFETWYKENSPLQQKGHFLPSRICELCYGTFFDLDTHLVSAGHKAAANDDSLFEGVDQLIARGTSLSEVFKKMEKRTKAVEKE